MNFLRIVAFQKRSRKLRPMGTKSEDSPDGWILSPDPSTYPRENQKDQMGSHKGTGGWIENNAFPNSFRRQEKGLIIQKSLFVFPSRP
jgi:hypothetical protein